MLLMKGYEIFSFIESSLKMKAIVYKMKDELHSYLLLKINRSRIRPYRIFSFPLLLLGAAEPGLTSVGRGILPGRRTRPCCFPAPG